MEHNPTTKAMLLSLNCARGEAATYAVLDFVSRSTNYLIVLLQEPWLNSNKEPPPMTGFDMFLPTPCSPKCATYIRKSAGLRPTLAFNEGDCFLGIRLSPRPPPHHTTNTQPQERGGIEDRDGIGNRNRGAINKINKINTKRDGKRRERGQSRTPPPDTMTIDPGPFTVYNLYSPGRQQAVCHLFHGFKPDRNAIICGDLNSHHRMWYGNKANRHQKHLSSDVGLAEGLVDNLLRLSLKLRNKPGKYTHFPRNGSSPSVVDLTFTRGRPEILSWSLGDDFGSDHRSSHLHIQLQTPPPHTRLAWSKANWPRFSQEVREAGLEFDNLTSPQEVERAAENYTASIKAAIQAAIPTIKPNSRKRIRGWWTRELDIISQSLREAQERSRQDPTNLDLATVARKMRNHRRNEVRAAKQSYLMLKLQTTGPQEVWKVLKGAQPAHTKAIPDLDGQSDFADKCNRLRSALFPQPTQGNAIPQLKPATADLTNEFDGITSTEVTRAIERCNKNSACGDDKLPYIAIAKAHQSQPSLLPQLFTASLQTGCFPGAWKHANCVVIPKGGKRDPHTAKSYRPISLLSNVSKVFEKLVARRIALASLATGALCNTQFGAIENRSAVDALFALTHPASTALEVPNSQRGSKAPRLDRPTLLANDIQGAFNNTDPERLVQIMRARKLPAYLANWTTSFTSSRTMSFCFDNCIETAKPYDSGLPQGSPVSPVLFLIYAQAMMEAPSYLKDKDVSYMDDDGALQLSTTQPYAVRRLQERMQLRIERGSQLNLPYDIAKAGLIHFWPRRSNQRPADPSSLPPVRMGDAVVKPSASIKHLGVHLDDTLSFHNHADAAASAGYKCLGQLAALRHSHRGLSAYTAIHLIKTALLPKMLWGSPVWWTGSQHILGRLEPVYHRALRWATGLPDFVPLRKLFAVSRCPPLHCTLNYLSARYAARLLFTSSDHPLRQYVGLKDRRITPAWLSEMRPREQEVVHYPTLRNPLSLVARLLGAGDILEETEQPGPRPAPPFKVQIPTIPPATTTTTHTDPPTEEVDMNARKATKHTEIITSLPTGSLLLYTDGSKLNDQSCGSGWIVGHPHEIPHAPQASGFCSLGKKAEVFDAELHAIQEGLLHILHKMAATAENIIICADNQAALTTLTKGNPDNWEYARNTLTLIAQLVEKGSRVSGLWTPGHCGIPGNELADRLAKQGANTAVRCPHARATKSWLYAAIQQQQIGDWNRRTNADKKFEIKPSTTFPPELRTLGPVTTRALFQLQTETTPSDPHPSKSPEQCRCGKALTSKHILLECPVFADARMDLFNPKINTSTDISIGDIRYNPSSTAALVLFMRRTGLGFTSTLKDQTVGPPSQADQDDPGSQEDWDDREVGPILGLAMDLRI